MEQETMLNVNSILAFLPSAVKTAAGFKPFRTTNFGERIDANP